MTPLAAVLLAVCYLHISNGFRLVQDTYISEQLKMCVLNSSACFNYAGINTVSLQKDLDITRRIFHGNEPTLDFFPLTNRPRIMYLCWKVQKAADCMSNTCSYDVAFDFQRNQFPIYTLCTHLNDFLSTPDCWKDNSFQNIIYDCYLMFFWQNNDSENNECNKITSTVKCVTEKFREVETCSERNKRFVDAVLHTYLDLDMSGLCSSAGNI